LVGALLGVNLRPPQAGDSMWSDHAVRTAAAAGVVIGAVVAGVGVLFSLLAGARLILRTSGATPATGDRYRPLRDLVDALAIGEGIPTPAVYVIEDPSPNAFSTGLGPSRAAITYTTGLLELMNHEELEGVTGRYFNGTQPASPHPQANDPDARRRLRELSSRLT